MSSTDGRSVVLHVWRLPNIQISMLSDSDLTEVTKLHTNCPINIILNLNPCFDEFYCYNIDFDFILINLSLIGLLW